MNNDLLLLIPIGVLVLLAIWLWLVSGRIEREASVKPSVPPTPYKTHDEFRKDVLNGDVPIDKVLERAAVAGVPERPRPPAFKFQDLGVKETKSIVPDHGCFYFASGGSTMLRTPDPWVYQSSVPVTTPVEDRHVPNHLRGTAAAEHYYIHGVWPTPATPPKFKVGQWVRVLNPGDLKSNLLRVVNTYHQYGNQRIECESLDYWKYTGHQDQFELAYPKRGEWWGATSKDDTVWRQAHQYSVDANAPRHLEAVSTGRIAPLNFGKGRDLTCA